LHGLVVHPGFAAVGGNVLDYALANSDPGRENDRIIGKESKGERTDGNWK
jgi:hypothetical protein